MLSYKPRISVGLSYLNDTDQLGSKIIDSYGSTSGRFGSSSLFSRGENYFLSRIKKVSANINVEVYRNFMIGLITQTTTSNPQHRINFQLITLMTHDQKVKSSLVDNSAELYLSFTPNEIFLDMELKENLGQSLSHIFIKFQKGLKIGAGQTEYSKLLFSYNQPLKLGKFGVLEIPCSR